LQQLYGLLQLRRHDQPLRQAEVKSRLHKSVPQLQAESFSQIHFPRAWAVHEVRGRPFF
jgi:hypothetical protein